MCKGVLMLCRYASSSNTTIRMWSPCLLPWPQRPWNLPNPSSLFSCYSIPGTLLYKFISIRKCHAPILPLCQWTYKFPSDSPRKHLPIHGTLKLPLLSPWNLIWLTSQHPNPITPSSVCCHTSNIVMITLLCNYWFTDVSTLLLTYVHLWEQRVWAIVQSINIW